MNDTAGCAGCRHHHKSERRKALDVADGDMELVAFDDEPETWIVCKHPEQLDTVIGKLSDAPGCTLFEAPARTGLDPVLERLLARRASR